VADIVERVAHIVWWPWSPLFIASSSTHWRGIQILMCVCWIGSSFTDVRYTSGGAACHLLSTYSGAECHWVFYWALLAQAYDFSPVSALTQMTVEPESGIWTRVKDRDRIAVNLELDRGPRLLDGAIGTPETSQRWMAAGLMGWFHPAFKFKETLQITYRVMRYNCATHAKPVLTSLQNYLEPPRSTWFLRDVLWLIDLDRLARKWPPDLWIRANFVLFRSTAFFILSVCQQWYRDPE